LELRLVPRLELISDRLLLRSMPPFLKVPPNYLIRVSDSTLPPWLTVPEDLEFSKARALNISGLLFPG
jgi:hypothetical protein